jgi:hypothetical protein
LRLSLQYLIGSKEAQGSGRLLPSPLLLSIVPPVRHGPTGPVPSWLQTELPDAESATLADLVQAVRRTLITRKVTASPPDYLVYRLAGKELTADRTLKQQGVTVGVIINVQYV